MKMLIRPDWLRAKIAEPEPEVCEAGNPTERDLAVEIVRQRDLVDDQHSMLSKVYGLTTSKDPVAALAQIRDEVGTFLYGATLEP